MPIKRIIPCLDVKLGRVVKGTHFLDLEDAGDPIELARYYDREGADALVFLDISASLEGRKTTLELAARVGEVISIPYIIGGGVSSIEDASAILEAGANRIAVNTAAFEDPSLVSAISGRYGPASLVVAIDGKSRGENSWEVVTRGGQTSTGNGVVEWAKRVEELGAGEILLTSMDRDGTGQGYDLPMTRAVCEAVSIPVIASGGAGELHHLAEVIEETGCGAVLAARIFHSGRHTISEAKRMLADRGIPVRL